MLGITRTAKCVFPVLLISLSLVAETTKTTAGLETEIKRYAASISSTSTDAEKRVARRHLNDLKSEYLQQIRTEIAELQAAPAANPSLRRAIEREVQLLQQNSDLINDSLNTWASGFDPVKIDDPIKPPASDSVDATNAAQPAKGKSVGGQALALSEDPNQEAAFGAVFGTGSLISGRNTTSYKITNDVMIGKSIGRASPELLLGGSFNLGFRKPTRWIGPTRPWNAFLSLRLAPGQEDVLSGYVFGGSYRISPHLDVLAGFALSPKDEPSIGFRNAAIQAITNNPTVSAYQRYSVTDINNGKANSLDGFPLLLQSPTGSTANRLYSGDPLVTHYRGGFFIGFSFPVEMLTHFKPIPPTDANKGGDTPPPQAPKNDLGKK